MHCVQDTAAIMHAVFPASMYISTATINYIVMTLYFLENCMCKELDKNLHSYCWLCMYVQCDMVRVWYAMDNVVQCACIIYVFQGHSNDAACGEQNDVGCKK